MKNVFEDYLRRLASLLKIKGNVTPTEERILNLVIEWSMTRYEVAIALIEAELKREARNLVKERREADTEEG